MNGTLMTIRNSDPTTPVTFQCINMDVGNRFDIPRVICSSNFDYLLEKQEILKRNSANHVWLCFISICHRGRRFSCISLEPIPHVQMNTIDIILLPNNQATVQHILLFVRELNVCLSSYYIEQKRLARS